jgi:suppressor of ftsI
MLKRLLPCLLLAVLGLTPAMSAGAMEPPAERCQQVSDRPGCERYRQAQPAPTTILPGMGREKILRALSQPVVDLKNGDHYTLRAQPVTKTIAGVPVRLYAYNGSIPGPLLRVRQGSTVTIDLVNAIDQDTTIHWHGLRLDNSQDGVPGVTQKSVPPGATHHYSLRFPDEGMYWYHPHSREDFQQDAGLYGNLWVLPANPRAYGPVDREEVLILDDILIQNGRQVPYHQDAADHALLGRYGNVLLVNGEEHYQLKVRAGERVRFYLTNAANARPFNIALPGIRLKRVGGDSGRYEREEYVDSVLLAPAERAIVEAVFEKPGSIPLLHDTPDKPYELGRIEVEQAAERQAAVELRSNPEVRAEIEPFKKYLTAPPDHTVMIGLDRPGINHQHSGGQPVPIEWEDTLGEINARYLSTATHWYLQDADSGKKNMAIHYYFQRGRSVKLRLINPTDGTHPMQHPIHFHGQRFLVLAVDGKPVDNQVWKDTVLVPAGSQVDIVLDPSNPGEWIAHCHIAEHLTAGMMLGFTVAEGAPAK